MKAQFTHTIHTDGRGFTEISELIQRRVDELDCTVGLVNVFLQHTSASILITENADSTVLTDLESVISRLAPDGDPIYQHNYEGDDDMAAHLRSMLTCTQLTIPIMDGRLALGTWQGVFLWEHRYRGRARKLILTFV